MLRSLVFERLLLVGVRMRCRRFGPRRNPKRGEEGGGYVPQTQKGIEFRSYLYMQAIKK